MTQHKITAREADIYNLGMDKGWNDGYHKGQVVLARHITEHNAHITELTTRNAELEAEVARLKSALTKISNADVYRYHSSSRIARNALKESGL